MEKNGLITTIITNVIEFFSKWWTYFFYVLIGMAGKFGIDLIRQRRMGFWQFLGSTFIACFVGFLASTYCVIHCPNESGFVVPIATLISDRIALFLCAVNWTPVLEWVSGKKDKNG